MNDKYIEVNNLNQINALIEENKLYIFDNNFNYLGKWILKNIDLNYRYGMLNPDYVEQPTFKKNQLVVNKDTRYPVLHLSSIPPEVYRLPTNEELKELVPQVMEKLEELQSKNKRLEDFCIWLTGCGYDFTQHDYFIKERDELLKDK